MDIGKMKKFLVVGSFLLIFFGFSERAQAQSCPVVSIVNAACGPVNGQTFAYTLPESTGNNYCSSGTVSNLTTLAGSHTSTWACVADNTVSCSASIVSAHSTWLTSSITVPSNSIFQVDTTANVTNGGMDALTSIVYPGKSCAFLSGPVNINEGIYKKRFQYSCRYNQPIPGDVDTLIFTANAGGATAQAWRSINVNRPNWPTLELTATPGRINSGETSTLSVAATGVTDCTGWGGILDQYGPRGTFLGPSSFTRTRNPREHRAANVDFNRDISVSPAVSTTYRVRCANSENETIEKSVTVSVTAPLAPCTLPWGGTIDSGRNTPAWQQAGCGCVQETRFCHDGNLSGSYGAERCTAILPRNGACGASHQGSFETAPTSGLCSSGSASAVSGAGPWSWTCSGVCGGDTTSCQAFEKIIQGKWREVSP